MIDRIDGILLSSHDPKRLSEFYKNTVGLELEEEFEMEDGTSVYSLRMKDGPGLFINPHSEIKEGNKEPARFMINFEVGEIESEVARLDGKNAKKVKDTYHIEGYGFVATYEDPDRNYFQLLHITPTN